MDVENNERESVESTESVERFRLLFAGLGRAYGALDSDGERIIVRDGLDRSQYVDHLMDGGQRMLLGVIPITDDGRVSFAAIQTATPDKLPDAFVQTDGAGWLFFDEPAPAANVRGALHDICDAIGLPDAVVFPQQDHLRPTDVGTPIDLPVIESGQLAAWLDDCEAKRIDLGQLRRVVAGGLTVAVDGDADNFADGPPCLQQIAARGGVGVTGVQGADVFLKATAVYATNKHETDDDGTVTELIHLINDATVKANDAAVAAALNDPAMGYPCGQDPLKRLCNRERCLRREWGVRLNGETFSITELYQYVPVSESTREEISDETSWQLHINTTGKSIRLDLTTEELYSASAVRHKAVNRRVVLPEFTNLEWRGLIGVHLHDVQVVHCPEDVSTVGELRTLLIDFLMLYGRRDDDNEPQDVVRGSMYLDQKRGLHVFRLDLLLTRLKQLKYDAHKGTDLHNALKDHFGAVHIPQYRVPGARGESGGYVRVWGLPVGEFKTALDQRRSSRAAWEARR